MKILHEYVYPAICKAQFTHAVTVTLQQTVKAVIPTLLEKWTVEIIVHVNLDFMKIYQLIKFSVFHVHQRSETVLNVNKITQNLKFSVQSVTMDLIWSQIKAV